MMLVSCIIVTRTRPGLLKLAIEGFLVQTVKDKEAVVVIDGDDAEPPREVVNAPGVRVIQVEGRQRTWQKATAGVKAARGEVIAHWDDDDWYARERLERQLTPILKGEADLSGIPTRWILDLANSAFYLAAEGRRIPFDDSLARVNDANLCYRKTIWEKHEGFDRGMMAEKVGLIRRSMEEGAKVAVIPNDGLFVYTRHPKATMRLDFKEFSAKSGRPDFFSEETVKRYALAARE
jgi:glycosyltransferase involved in cell wall biosynthesis